MSVNILIGADIVPTPSNEELFAKGDVVALLGDRLYSILKEADFVALNLEVPLTNKETPIVKCGPCLRAAEDSIKGLLEINPYFYTLANNHIMDQGPTGLENTITLLKKYNIAFAGVGNTIEEAARPYTTEIKGLKIGFYCCAEHEFSIVTEKSPGANPYDPLESFDAVRRLSEECDIVIVLYHGGKEMYQYPSPMLQKVFRKFADVGADVVIAQHTHCIGCMEEYNGSTLVYGQGNFLFDRRNRGEMWETSLLMQITVDEGTGKVACSYLPLRKNEVSTSLAEGDDSQRIFGAFLKRSEEIQGLGFIGEEYGRFAERMQNGYYRRISGIIGISLWGKLINKITKTRFWGRWYSSKCLPLIENVLDCEAHRELFLCGLERSRVGYDAEKQ